MREIYVAYIKAGEETRRRIVENPSLFLRAASNAISQPEIAPSAARVLSDGLLLNEDRVVAAILVCRTAKLGGSIQYCRDCGATHCAGRREAEGADIACGDVPAAFPDARVAEA